MWCRKGVHDTPWVIVAAPKTLLCGVIVFKLDGVGKPTVATADVHIGGETVIGTRHSFHVGVEKRVKKIVSVHSSGDMCFKS